MARGYFDTDEEQDDKSTANQGRGSDKSRAVGTGGTTGADNFGNDLMQGEDIGKGHQPGHRQPSALDTDEND
jgi:hypothetical protein